MRLHMNFADAGGRIYAGKRYRNRSGNQKQSGVFYRKGIVLREPSVVVYDKDTEKIRAIGEEARQMASHLTSNMEVIWPIRGGVIVDYNVMERC